MVTMSYLSSIERYAEYRGAIQDLLASVLTGIGQAHLINDATAMRAAMCHIAEHYPFVDLIYTLDADGIQTSPNISCSQKHKASKSASLGVDRSQRPYYQLARTSNDVVVTGPYLSTASRKLCVSAALKCKDSNDGVAGYIVVDIDLADTIEFLMGDSLRRKFIPGFRLIYGVIVAGLFAVVGVLLFSAFYEITSLFTEQSIDVDFHLRPFGIIIFLTLGLAIFDLGKTILEEEVLMHKDIYRHSSTRRTITRFIAAILIAVSIESLLMMFKAALNAGQSILPAVWMMLTAVGLLVGLGLYVYLGARAELSLLQRSGQAR